VSEVHGREKSKMAEGRHLENLKKIAISDDDVE